MDAARTRRTTLAIGAVAFLLLTTIFASLGGPHALVEALVTVIYVGLLAGLAPAAYLGAGIGLGRLFLPLTRTLAHAGAIRAALGVATLLWISSLLGSLRVDVTIVGRIVAGVPIALGLVLLAIGIVRDRSRTPCAWSAALVVPASLLVAAALNPPGWLWSSEFGGYDALSYHLQLPQEWMAIGRIVPVEHNVYSFLPGAIESAFVHVGVLAGAARPYEASAPTGLLTAEGYGAISCQLLHAGLAIFSAWLVGRAGVAGAERLGMTGRSLVAAEICASLLFLVTPWVIVTGSLAYNEMGVTAMLAGATLVAIDETSPAWTRGVLAGWLIGIACLAKPTALFLAGVPLGLVLLGLLPARGWIACAGAGSLAGLLALSPWLGRNLVEAANPFFPYATSIFGEAHWTTEQVERFASHHAFEGSLADRLALTVVPDPTDPAGARHRGLLHAQWLVFFPLATLGAIVALARSPRSRLVWLLVAMLVCQLALWLALTHVQSRFLLPLAVTGAVLFGLGAARVASIERLDLRVGALGACALAIGVQLAGSISIFARQNGAMPNARLLMPPAMLAGEGLGEEAILESAHATINRLLPPDARVYLLGDAAPFYVTRDVLYNTTWDAWPLGEAVRAHPGDPGAWTRTLRARGVDHVLVDEVGLGLFWRSGTADPLVTPDVVRAWLADPSTRPLQSWEAEGKILLRLEEGS